MRNRHVEKIWGKIVNNIQVPHIFFPKRISFCGQIGITVGILCGIPQVYTPIFHIQNSLVEQFIPTYPEFFLP